jgi:SAM-dependent methyltransferase
MPFEDLKARTAAVWSSAPWEQAAPLLAPVHRQLTRLLSPGPGVRWLDAATGTGAVAQLAARAGADVTGVDLAPGLIETARRLAGDEGLDIRFDVGDAEALPYEDASFDVVSSSMGVVFAPDHEAAARELARVCRPGGRIGFSAWHEGAGFFPVLDRYSPPLLPGQGESLDWSRKEYVEAMLGDAFELEFEQGDAPVTGRSGEEIWQLVSTSAGPLKARVETLEPEEVESLHGEFVELLESACDGDSVRLPAPYLVVLGTRRAVN